MSADDYWKGPRGVIRQLERWQAGQIYIHFRGELESKSSRQVSGGLAFQEHVRKAMSQHGRTKPFRVPVAIEMEFTPGLGRPAPDIHSLPKHYLDLLQWPADGSPKDKARLLLQDDRQVKALICLYPLGIDHGNPGLRLRVTTLTSFLRQLDVVSRIIGGDLTRGLSRYDLRKLQPRDLLQEWEDDEQDDPLYQYREHVRGRQFYEQRLSSEAYEATRMFLQQRCQEKLLTLTDPRPEQLAGLLRGHLVSRRPSSYRHLLDLLSADTRGWYSLIGIDLGPSAAREGESSAFKANVRQKLAEVRKKQGLMYPLLTTLGATILYVPPKKALLIDIDNLARRVIPFVHQELQPPSTLQRVASAYDAVRQTETEYAEQNRKELKELNRLPVHQVSRYQIFELPRSERDPDGGRVQLLLHSGLGSYGAWHDVENIIDTWKDWSATVPTSKLGSKHPIRCRK